VEIEEGFLTCVTRRARMRREGKGRVTAVRNDGDVERKSFVVDYIEERFMWAAIEFVSRAEANSAEEHSQEWLCYEKGKAPRIVARGSESYQSDDSRDQGLVSSGRRFRVGRSSSVLLGSVCVCVVCLFLSVCSVLVRRVGLPG
jgi:hypothetical protein